MSETTTASTSVQQAAEQASGGAGIKLEDVSKLYPGQTKPAVDKVNMDIAAGEVIMFVGPSGCGKTTTLKMINRLIEPTSGKIIIGDDDVTRINADQLRRRIGYVIQAGGLFPHMSVAANIALVPGLLKWDKKRTESRVDELLDLVGLDPGQYRNRFPRELSGGQQQRVGVARALAADPPVLLMDEPFGAVDPITRLRLQEELIRIHEEVPKTICFVTHDFDEAVKLGDRIAILTEQAHIAQFDTPDNILANPANEFVENFIGHGSTLKQLTLTQVKDVQLERGTTVTVGEDAAGAVGQATQAGHRTVLVLDGDGRPIRWEETEVLRRTGSVEHGSGDVGAIAGDATLSDALNTLLVSTHGYAVVTGEGERFVGLVSVESVMQAVQSQRSNAREPRADDARAAVNDAPADTAATADTAAAPVAAETGGTAGQDAR